MRSLALVAICFYSGCSCEETAAGVLDGAAQCEPACGASEVCCNMTNQCQEDPAGKGCVDATVCENSSTLTCEPGYCFGLAEDADIWNESACEVVPQTCTCVEAPALEPGLIGRHSAIALFQGILYASAYEEDFGDLLLGISKDQQKISWTIIDGLPESGTLPTNAPSGYRDGVSTTGPDVGYYTSIQVGTDGVIHISYFDLSSGTLNYARVTQDETTNHTVDAIKGATVGLYSSLVVIDGGARIAYMAHGLSDAGVFYAQTRVALALVTSPTSSSDWEITVIEETVIPCAGLCQDTDVCLADNWQCTTALTESDCGDCASDAACVNVGAGPVCITILRDPTLTDLPYGVGLWASLAVAPGGQADVVYYSHLPESGEVHGAHYDGAVWEAPVVFDAGDDRDVGQGACLTVDDKSVLHMSYSDAVADDLIYLQWNGSSLVREVVDDGDRGDGDLHVVGADSSIVVGKDQTVRIVYQDQTVGDLLLATRGTSEKWEVSVVAEGSEGITYGFYNHFVTDDSGAYVSTFYYAPAEEPGGGLELFVIP